MPIRIVMLLLVLTAVPRVLSAREPPPRARRPVLRVDSELEYYLPTKRERPIYSTFANCVVGAELWRGVLSLAAGVTSTVAWGSITQWDENFRDVRYDTTAAGLGPIFLIRIAPFGVGAFGVVLDLLGGLVAYSVRFPPGGDLYNFTWRMGGALVARMTDNLFFTAGIRWMHVSNGQGLGPQNPSYEGVGFPVDLMYRF
jgi:hypothetical protein